jgi:hypothetical protein
MARERPGAGELIDVVLVEQLEADGAADDSRPVCMPVSPWPHTTPRTGCGPGRRSASTPSLLATRIRRRLSA